MPRIYYTANDYTGNYTHVNTNNEEFVLCRKVDLYRAIVTVGNPSFFSWKSVSQNGFFRTLSDSIIQKVLLVQANIESNPGGIGLHPIFHGYVSDKKRSVSYNLGMAVAKIYAEKLLDIPNLIHVESLKKINAITFIEPDTDEDDNKKKRTREPDLVGKTSDGQWHIFEAKGTSSKYLDEKIKDAKEQGEQIETIYGLPPATISACATSFTENKIFTKIVDPSSEKGKKIEVDIDRFYENYYSPFFALREASEKISHTIKRDNLEINSFTISTGKLDLTVGLDVEIYELLQERNISKIEQYYNKNKSRNFDSVQENRASIGIDGFYIKYSNY